VIVVVAIRKVRAAWNFIFDKLLYVSLPTIYYVKVPRYFTVSEQADATITFKQIGQHITTGIAGMPLQVLAQKSLNSTK
jgi:hypothetical protein